MRPARWPRLASRLLVMDGGLVDARPDDLPGFLRAGDLLVVNDAATYPASLRTSFGGRSVEIRLAAWLGGAHFAAALLGDGSWRQRTEDRPAPPVVRVGDRFPFATVSAVDVRSPRLVELTFDADPPWAVVFAHGRPIQYSYLADDTPLDAFENGYAARPWAAKMPSAGRILTFERISALRARGVGLAAVTVATGLSSTGDAAIDALLPLPERYDYPSEAAERIRTTKAAGGRVVAVGTSVVRALEGGEPGVGITDLVVGPHTQLSVVDALLSGIHAPGESHYGLLEAFAPADALARATAFAEAHGYLGHEFGDAALLFR